MDWYAVRTHPRKEAFAELSLERLGVQTFSPRLRQEKVIRRRLMTVVAPLFPGYLFAWCDLGTQYRAVSYAKGVRGFVAFGSGPARVEASLIESIRLRLEDGYVVVRPRPLVPGQVVRIEEGPLEGLSAVFERELSDRQRVVLLLHTLAYGARVVVPREHVAPL